MKLKIPLTFKYRFTGLHWVGKCVELDILTSDTSLWVVKKDIKKLAKAQCKYAIKNKLLHNLFRQPPTQEPSP